MSFSKISRRRMLLWLGGAALLPRFSMAATETTVRLSDLDLTLIDQQWNVAKANQSLAKTPLSIAGKTYDHGVATHANSLLILHLAGGAKRFRAFAGVDDSTGNLASVRFSISGDGRELWKSEVCKKGNAALPIDIDVSGVNYLTLRVDDAGDGISEDHADWAGAVLEGVTKTPVLVSRRPDEKNLFLPGRQWLDTNGNLIQAHGGGLMRHEGKWYWYGEDRSNGYVAIGVSGYVSDDLLNWQHLGLVLPRTAYNEKHGDQTLCERPKVAYNPATKKFVMWFHYDRSGYGDSRGGVAIADKPEGPFRFLGAQRPIETSTFRDMNLFVDDDGKAYVFYAGEDNWTMHVVRLNKEWTAPEMPMVEGQTWNRILVRKMREAPAPFKHDGKYYLITSACTGWAPNAGDLAVADSPLGPYKSLGNPFIGPTANTSFDTQSTYVIPQPGAPDGHFLYLGDRWKPEALQDARYVWLPFQIQNGKAEIQWTDSFSLAK
jgi:hypothetical protein